MYLCMSDSRLVALLLLRVTPYRHPPEILWVHFQTTRHANVWFPKLCLYAL